MLDQKWYVADGGYNPDPAIPSCFDEDSHERIYMQIARSRHETVNNLLKTFRSLDCKFSRAVEKHETFFYAIANIIQVGIVK